MGLPNFENRTLFQGDNLPFLQGLNSESVDLIATDPPFNKSKDFHATPDSLAAGASFSDRWRWEQDVQQEWVDALTDDWPGVMDFINGVKTAGNEDMAAFLCWLGVRLLECHRILKPTGSLYLHIDHTAQAYAKVLLDNIFGRKNCRNELVWKRTNATKSTTGSLSMQHDTILWYTKSGNYTFNPPKRSPDDKGFKPFSKDDGDGKGRYQTIALSNKTGAGGYAHGKVSEWRGKTARWIHSLETRERWWAEGLIVETPTSYRKKDYLSDFLKRGAPVTDLWTDGEVSPLQGKDPHNTGYPTQKPLALYERIIKASSKPGDVVLDPHCGCATTPVAAERLGRQWIGMDIWDDAHRIVLDRLNAEKQIWRPEDVRLITRPPERTDAGETAAPYLPQLQGKVAKPPRFSREQMKAILIGQWGAVCWGCGFEPPKGDDRHFDLDHNWPKSAGGHNDLDNRAILCRPCNGRKSNKLALDGLRTANRKDGYWYGNPPIDQRIPLQLAVAWAREYLEKADK